MDKNHLIAGALPNESADEIFDNAIETLSKISDRIEVARLAVAAFYPAGESAAAHGHVKVFPGAPISICSVLTGVKSDLVWQINELETVKMMREEKCRNSSSAGPER
ncbi:MAG: hypothetical protein HY067_09580 [Betaproteobacteria bacterium]|nr:hypothetical protein [Betaproteobacteria bacterium]